ncbi:MAG TPA: immunoglobulin domain-containing protein [Candidatus Acidoferrum sp.]|nr:immunoglobulin domain-containing protein [Candidatus Acidoferrum sp.]
MIRLAKHILTAGFGGLALGLLAWPVRAAQPAVLPADLPLYFEAASGPGPAAYRARGRDHQFEVSATGVQMALRKTAAETAGARMQFVGANALARVEGDSELRGKINYLTGNDPAQWRVGVNTFARVRVEELYPGVSLVYYGNQRQLEFDFTVAPGADPGTIVMHFDGADRISVNPEGGLTVSLPGGEIRQHRPLIYQAPGGVRKEIAGGYRLVDARTAAFTVGEYDHGQPLIIDPVLNYSGYFGGTAGDMAWAVAVDTNGFVYLAGETFSQAFFTNGWAGGPAFSTYGAFQTNFAGGKLTGDAFVAKLDISSEGTTLEYLTYLGGSADDGVFSLALDAAGDAYVTGFTDSTNFPVTTNALFKKISGTFNSNVGFYPIDAIVAELDASGSNLVYSTYLGGSGADSGFGIAVDSSNNAYVTGYTYSSNFPVVNAIQPKPACTNSFVNANAFIARIGPGGSPLVYSTYYGGNNFDQGQSIAVDHSNFVYVTGFTASTNFPTVNYVHQTVIGGIYDGHQLNRSTNQTDANDAFVLKFAPGGIGTNRVYSTLLGSTNNDVAMHIAADDAGAAYVTGWTISSNFPNTVGTSIPGLYSYIATNRDLGRPATNVFLTKLTNGPQAGIEWSALFGGRGSDVGYGVALDPAGNVFVAGATSSTNFPTYNIPGYLVRTNSGKSDAFVIAFNPNATALLYSAYIGGKQNDYGYSIAVDTNSSAYIVGQTLSTNFPSLPGALDMLNGTNDAFLSKILLNATNPVITGRSGTNWEVYVGRTLGMSVTATGTPILTYQWQKIGTNLVDIVGTNVVDDGNISGSTNSLLIFNFPQTTNSGNYVVIVTNYAGAVTSAVYRLLVTNIPPRITLQPTNQTVGVGSGVSLAVAATGTAPLFYQWQKDGTNLTNGSRFTGVTNTVLTINNAQLTNGGAYTVVVTNGGGSVTSAVAVLTVAAAPVILVQPQPANQAIAVGTTASFTVNAVGTPLLVYRWRQDGTNLVDGGNISGSTSQTLTIANAQTTNSGNYSVLVTNVDGSVLSSNAVLTVTNVPPTITVPPTNQTVGAKTTVTFAVSAAGTAPLNYQWQLSGTNLINNSHVSGVTGTTLTITNVMTNDMGNYVVIVTNVGGSATSAVATLTVVASPVILVQPPATQSLQSGATATFTVTAIGAVPLSYQWQVNGTNLVNGGNISGARTNALTISAAQPTNSGTYTVVITNIAGTVTSSNAVLTVTNAPPTITQQPTNQAVVVGTTVSMTVGATGTGPLSYQWRKDGTNLMNGGGYIGVATSTLTISHAQTNQSGIYTVVITNLAGTVTSSNAVLTVASSPVILVQPVGQDLEAGATAVLSVSAVGTLPLSYQWRKDGTNLANGGGISGATTGTLTLTNLQTSNSGLYSVVITNRAGSVTSSNALLTVTNVPIQITTQPKDRSVAVGTFVALGVVALGSPVLTYQWQKDGSNLVDGGNISGSTNYLLFIDPAQTTNSGVYRVIVSNPAGSVISSNAVLTVTNVPPSLISQPLDQTVGAGSTATFAVTASGTTPFSYQWQVNGTNLVEGGNISGATTNVLTLSNVQTNDAGIYTVIVTNPGGSVTSSNALLTVLTAPLITRQPTNQTVGLGANATLVVTAIGLQPLSYQWQLDGTNLVDGGNVSGATTNVLNISSAQLTNSGLYTVVVTNTAGSATSSNAVLTVTALPVILVQPTNVELEVGSTATLAVTAVGLAPLAYQWQVDGTNLVDGGNIAGANTNVLVINDAQTTNSGAYTVIVTNLAGAVTSSNAVVTITNAAPTITTQPASQTVNVGATVRFSVSGYGTPPFFFQWQKDATNLVDGGRISGSTNFQLVIVNAQVSDSGSYQLIVTNYGGMAVSSNALLTVLSSPTFQNITYAGGTLILSGAGGTNGGTYYVLSSSNLLVPVGSWAYLATNHFDSQGGFVFTNTPPASTPQLFYLLQMP